MKLTILGFLGIAPNVGLSVGTLGRPVADLALVFTARREAEVTHGRFDQTFGEFLLPYAEARAAEDPERMLGEFLESAYKTAANLAKWDRPALEREPVAP